MSDVHSRRNISNGRQGFVISVAVISAVNSLSYYYLLFYLAHLFLSSCLAMMPIVVM